MVIVLCCPSRRMADGPTSPFHFTRRIAYDDGIRFNGVSIVDAIPVRRG